MRHSFSQISGSNERTRRHIRGGGRGQRDQRAPRRLVVATGLRVDVETRRHRPLQEQGGHGRPFPQPHASVSATPAAQLYHFHRGTVSFQTGDMEFNRAKLLNIGYALAQKFGPYDCYAFHDIDCVPKDDRNLYNCADQPRHLGVGMEKFTYKIPYDTFYGCACLMTGWQVEKVNGWSNRYFGWGGEDDNMWRRIKAEKMQVWRVSDHLATYATLKHKQATLNPRRMNILRTSERDYKLDGLNSLQFTLLNSTHRKLYTKFLVKL
ncbi:beta-1,4-N-acetylgalactosaminyltransferase bre-4-like isoform X2 [Penaeus chinensis]|uniref:beta-1,4-N-acetylgalactosaminyltransferase bre-4-like isoform X2 n=1 Tax=Penaeus chinensis TaxID=139456 RepID=UPI001FB6CA95|nr:beta-1,4-N-acetylgalactosaminyltransferase bre-4-like isoform X2 [Penaeus chinensis]